MIVIISRAEQDLVCLTQDILTYCTWRLEYRDWCCRSRVVQGTWNVRRKSIQHLKQSSLFFDLLCGSFFTFWWDSFWGILLELLPTIGRSNAHPLNLDTPLESGRSSKLIRMARTSSAAPPCPTSTGCPQGQSEHGQSVLIHLTDVQATMLQGHSWLIFRDWKCWTQRSNHCKFLWEPLSLP